MPALRNARHELYCQERAKGATQTAAYVTAGYSPKAANVAACKVEKRKDVQERIANLIAENVSKEQAATAKAVEKLAVTREDVLREVWDNAMKAKAGEPVYDREGKPTGEWIANFAASNKALELFGREAFGMFVNVTKILRSPFDDLGYEETKALLEGLNAALTASAPQPVDAGKAGSVQPSNPARTTH